MKQKHYKEKLSAFLNRELPSVEHEAVGEHLLYCRECRQEHDQIRFGARLAGQLERADAPEYLWERIEAELDKKESASIVFGSRPRILAFASLALIAFLAGGLFFYLDRPLEKAEGGPQSPGSEPAAAWQVETLAGAPRIENSASPSDLKVGGVLETDENSRAKIDVADIGQVEVAPNSLVKLVGSSEKEHRLALERGALKARIYAPPRLFVVDTPSAVAVDLGCAYRLDVDEEGNSRLHVTSGYVSLEREGRESMVPAGGLCLTRRGRGLGTPFLETASDRLKNALYKFDFEGGGEASLKTVLRESRRADTLTLWHLLSRVSENDRLKVFQRAAALVKPPEGVRREGVLRLDREMLEKWRGEMELWWYEY
ncbi:MAG: FecR domain-containing protein [Pyrinomonadaceae bacterium]